MVRVIAGHLLLQIMEPVGGSTPYGHRRRERALFFIKSTQISFSWGGGVGGAVVGVLKVFPEEGGGGITVNCGKEKLRRGCKGGGSFPLLP